MNRDTKDGEPEELVVIRSGWGWFWISQAMMGVCWNLYFLYNFIEAISEQWYIVP